MSNKVKARCQKEEYYTSSLSILNEAQQFNKNREEEKQKIFQKAGGKIHLPFGTPLGM